LIIPPELIWLAEDPSLWVGQVDFKEFVPVHSAVNV
jgi:hypothetical protein